MLSGPVFEVGLGLILAFLLASLLASAVIDTVAGLLHRRSKHLWDSLVLLLQGTPVAEGGANELVDQLYQHAAVANLVRPGWRDKAGGDGVPWYDRWGRQLWRTVEGKPGTWFSLLRSDAVQHGPDAAYLPRRFYGPARLDGASFATALIAALRPDAPTPAVADGTTAGSAGGGGGGGTDAAPAAGAPVGAGLAGVPSGVLDGIDRYNALPPEVRARLHGLVTDASASADEVRRELAAWYDRQMVVVTDWYRRQTRWFLFVAGLLIAVFGQFDALRVATTLYRDADTRAAVVAVAGQVGARCASTTNPGVQVGPAVGTTSPSPPATTSPAAQPQTQPQLSVDCVTNLFGPSASFPVGPGGPGYPGLGGLVRWILGRLLVAGAVTMGAPFWYDLLGRALRARGGGQTTGAPPSPAG